VHIFSNLSLVVHSLLPLLFHFSDRLVCIQLRSTCHFYRRAYYAHFRSVLTIDDILIFPLQFDVVFIRDWGAQFLPGSRERSWNSLALCPTFRPATNLELSSALVHTPSLVAYTFGCLPSITCPVWSDHLYLSSRALTKHHARCSLVRISGIPHPIFGNVSCEHWVAARGLSHFTVRDIARICSSAYVLWHLQDGSTHLTMSTRVHPLESHNTKSARTIMKGVLRIRQNNAVDNGYVFDPIGMPGYTYP
jgi:hypothetical protein